MDFKILKEKRLKKKITLASVSKKIQVSVNFLKAIEAGELNLLPKGGYRKIYIKKYSEFLNVDFPEFAQAESFDETAVKTMRKERFRKRALFYYIVFIIIFLVFLLLISYKLRPVSAKPDEKALFPATVLIEEPEKVIEENTLPEKEEDLEEDALFTEENLND